MGPGWKEDYVDLIMSMLPMDRWPPELERDVRWHCRTAISLAFSAATRGLPLAECGRDAVLTLRMVDPLSVDDRDSGNYSAGGLVEVLSRQGVLTPIVCVTSGERYIVIHGQHRIKAYSALRMPVLAIVCTAPPGDGKIVVKNELEHGVDG